MISEVDKNSVVRVTENIIYTTMEELVSNNRRSGVHTTTVDLLSNRSNLLWHISASQIVNHIYVSHAPFNDSSISPTNSSLVSFQDVQEILRSDVVVLKGASIVSLFQ